MKFSKYQQITRSKTFITSISELSAITATAKALFEVIELEERSIRLLGISISNLSNEKQSQIVQLPLFES